MPQPTETKDHATSALRLTPLPSLSKSERDRALAVEYILASAERDCLVARPPGENLVSSESEAIVPSEVREYRVSEAHGYKVPPAVRERFAANLDRQSVGWRERNWYVVIAGRRPGVYYDYW